MKNEIVCDNHILNTVNEVEKLISKGEITKTFEKLKKNFPDNFDNLEKALLNYMGKIILKFQNKNS